MSGIEAVFVFAACGLLLTIGALLGFFLFDGLIWLMRRGK